MVLVAPFAFLSFVRKASDNLSTLSVRDIRHFAGGVGNISESNVQQHCQTIIGTTCSPALPTPGCSPGRPRPTPIVAFRGSTTEL